jgi:DNA-binding MarR family transcriptional regulator
MTESDGGRPDPAGRSGWTFLTNHALVLVCLAGDHDLTAREVAGRVGITMRAAQGIIADLAAAGYLRIEHRGRRNHYLLDPAGRLRHAVVARATVGDLLAVLAPGPALPAPGPALPADAR